MENRTIRGQLGTCKAIGGAVYVVIWRYMASPPSSVQTPQN